MRRGKIIFGTRREGDTAGGQQQKLDPFYKVFFILCCLFIIGIALGAILVSLKDYTLIKYLSILTKSGLEARVTGKLFATFISCIIPHLILILLCYLFANCTFGTPLILALIIFKGASAGLTGGYIHLASGAKGILYNFIFTMIPTLLSAIGFLWLAVYSMKASITLHSVAIKGSGRKIKDINAQVYHMLATAAMLSGASAIVEAILFKLFGGFFI